MRRYRLIALSLASAVLLATGCGTTKDTSGPVFENSSHLRIAENGADTIQISASDKNGVHYTLAGGADANKFRIDPTSGLLQFVTPPDYENPSDSDGDGVYEVIIEATDDKGNSTTQPITIMITDDITDNGPAFTSADSVTVRENSALDFDVTADARSGTATYRIAGGSDGMKFRIDPQSGELSFADFRPDFDRPSDADKNNRYEIVIEAADDRNHTSIQHFSVKITDDPNDPIPAYTIWKTGADDGVVAGLPFGENRDFDVKNPDGQRIIVAGDRMWEDSPHTVDTTVTFYGAQDYCSALEYGGYSDWRVPNRHELAEMLNYGNRGNMFDDIFQNRRGTNYWTSQEKLASGGGGSGLGWSISFADGGVHDKNKADALNVRCVRGKEIVDHHDFSVEGDIVIDNKTGLMWQNAEFIGGRSWEEAKTHCRELVFGGYDDWRLPNVNEMHTIMPYDNNEILFEDLSPIGPPDLDSGHSWSSTEADDTHAYYNLNDWDEATNRDSLIIMYEEYPKTDSGNLMLNRCIRGGHL